MRCILCFDSTCQILIVFALNVHFIFWIVSALNVHFLFWFHFLIVNFWPQTFTFFLKVSEIFGGLAICSLEAVVAKDGREVNFNSKTCICREVLYYRLTCFFPTMNINFMRLQVIIEVNDCALGLMGESQEEDRRLIADLVLQQMETRCGLMPQELMVSIRDLVPFVDQLAPTISPMSLSLSQLATTISPMPLSLFQLAPTISPMPLSLSHLCPTRPNVDLPVLPHSSPTHPLQWLVRPPVLSVCQSFLKHCIIIFNRWTKLHSASISQHV